MPSVVVILAEIYQRGGTDTSLVTVAVAEIPVDSCQFECPLYEPSTIFGQQRRVVGSMRGVLRLAWTGDPQKSRVSSVKWENIIECSDRYSESLVNTMKKCNTSGISGVWGAPYHGLFIPFTLYYGLAPYNAGKQEALFAFALAARMIGSSGPALKSDAAAYVDGKFAEPSTLLITCLAVGLDVWGGIFPYAYKEGRGGTDVWTLPEALGEGDCEECVLGAFRLAHWLLHTEPEHVILKAMKRLLTTEYCLCALVTRNPANEAHSPIQRAHARSRELVMKSLGWHSTALLVPLEVYDAWTGTPTTQPQRTPLIVDPLTFSHPMPMDKSSDSYLEQEKWMAQVFGTRWENSIHAITDGHLDWDAGSSISLANYHPYNAYAVQLTASLHADGMHEGGIFYNRITGSHPLEYGTFWHLPDAVGVFLHDNVDIGNTVAECMQSLWTYAPDTSLWDTCEEAAQVVTHLTSDFAFFATEDVQDTIRAAGKEKDIVASMCLPFSHGPPPTIFLIQTQFMDGAL